MTVVRLRAIARGRAGQLSLAAALGVLFALATVAPAFAQEATATEAPIGGSVSGYGVSDWMNLILRLGLVLLIIWVAIAAMRWWVRRMNGAVGSTNGHLEIVETRSLGPNRSLQLVKVGGRAVLLGVTAEQISSVLEIDDPVEVERLARPSVAKDGPTSLSDAVSRLGALTRLRPVIERKRSASERASGARAASERASGAGAASRRAGASGTAAARAALARTTAQRQASGAASRTQPAVTAAAPRSRWMKLARQVVGLEDPPRRPAAAAPPRAAAAAPRRTATSRGRAPRGITSAATTAAELPASRAVRARSGYRQNQIAEAQQAISSVRAGIARQ